MHSRNQRDKEPQFIDEEQVEDNQIRDEVNEENRNNVEGVYHSWGVDNMGDL